MADIFEIVIEEDGTISLKTDEISPLNHRSADEFLKHLNELVGGEVKATKLPHSHGAHSHHVKIND